MSMVFGTENTKGGAERSTGAFGVTSTAPTISLVSSTPVEIRTSHSLCGSMAGGQKCQQPRKDGREQKQQKPPSWETLMPIMTMMFTIMSISSFSGACAGEASGSFMIFLVSVGVFSLVVVKVASSILIPVQVHLPKALGCTRAAAVLTFVGSVLLLPTVNAGQCAFTQECFQFGLDTDCTPVPAEGDAATSFPMDASHGFGVVHDKVWDGSVEDPSTGLCEQGTPDADGRCIVDFVAPKGLKPVAPIICPQYEGDGCCSWQQNYALYRNLGLLVDSFGSSTGCLACAVNLVNFWCALVCAPDQGSFASLHDPPYDHRPDDLTGGSSRVLQLDVTVDADMACRIYESCKSIAIVGETTAMQSGLGLLKFQMQTGAVGHGEFFFPSFANESIHSSLGHSLSPPDPMPSSVPPSATLDAQASGSEESGQEGSSITPSKAASALPSSSSSSFMSFDTLSCEAFYDPGSRTVPFAYPPKKEKLISCTCDYCLAACSGGSSIHVDVSNKNPIPVLDGFGFGLVGAVYAAVAVCSATLFWWRKNRQKRAAASWASVQ